jgi:predicted phosphoadenosine phosphosulfate sulfurtransferase
MRKLGEEVLLERRVSPISKIYTTKDVLTAARERIALIFSYFKRLYLCVSGGKDSSVMLQLLIRALNTSHRR